jgi:hypothetical protein
VFEILETVALCEIERIHALNQKKSRNYDFFNCQSFNYQELLICYTTNIAAPKTPALSPNFGFKKTVSIR